MRRVNQFPYYSNLIVVVRLTAPNQPKFAMIKSTT